MKYTVGIAVDARAYIEVEAVSAEDAKRKAVEEFCDFDAGDLEYIEWNAINAESEDGEFVDF